MKMKETTKKVITRNIEITEADLTMLLLKHFKDVPLDAKITTQISIPGGGDWSNMTCLLDDVGPIAVKIEYEDGYEV
jgi:hypothetical protein